MELWNGMEWDFGMEYGMKILSNAFGVRVKNVISWNEKGHLRYIIIPTVEWKLVTWLVIWNIDKAARNIREMT